MPVGNQENGTIADMMKASRQSTFLRFVLSAILMLMAFTACSGANAASPEATQPPTAAPVQDTPTAIPSPTPAAARVVLVAGPGVAAGQLQAAQSLLDGLSKSANLVLDVRPTLQPADLTPDVRVVVLLSSLENLADLAAAAAQTQFVVVSAADMNPTANLSVIRPRVEQQAFLAGYIATLLSSDHRSAGLLPSDGSLGSNLEQAFINGGRYYCGRCVPVYAPLISFPLASSQPAGTDAAGWQAAYAQLNQAVLETVYVSPEAGSPELLSALAGQENLLLLGGQTPPDAIKPRWAVTLRLDALTALQTLWPDLIAGKGGQLINLSPELTDVNEQYLSAGRMRLVEDLMKDLTSGMVAPFTPPPQ